MSNAMEGVPKLLYDLEVSIGLPLVLFAMFWANAQFSKRTWSRNKSSWFHKQLIRLSISFCLLGFAFLFGIAVIYQDRPIWGPLWQSSPIRFSLLYTFVVVLIAAIISAIVWWKLRPSLWSLGNPESNA